MDRKVISGLVLGVVFCLAGVSLAQVALVKEAVPQRGFFDTTIPTVNADRKGFFKDEGVKTEIFWTSGGAETVRVVTAASADVGLATGTEAVITAYQRGAPVRVISAQMTGSPDLFWYARADSPFKTIQDLKGRSLGFSRPGSSTHMVISLANDYYKLGAKLVPLGGAPDSYTAVMTRQVDVGWSVPPFFLEKVQQGELRIVLRGADVPELKDVTLRVHFANSDYLAKNPQAVRAYLKAMKRSLDFLYNNPKEAAKLFAEFNKIPLAVAEEGMKFYPRESMALAPIKGMDFVVKLGIKMGMLKTAPSPEELKKLIWQE